MEKQTRKSRTLIYSQRRLSVIMPYRCPHFEFEDVIADVDAADFVFPRFSFNSRRHTFTKKLAYHTPIVLNPGVEEMEVTDNYDLFFAICGNPTDLLQILALRGWRSKCRKAVCLIDELWVTQIGAYRNYLKMLREFDLVIFYYSQTAKVLSEHIGTRCLFLPPGVDAIRFCPYPNPPERVVDVYSIGRRSPIAHRALLDMAEKGGYFYLYDSIAANQVMNPKEHRMLFANTLKRSRYFIVNPGLIDMPQVRGDQIEIGNRYFEGAAAGAIMIGVRPENGGFEDLFNWPDPMIHTPWDSSAIADVIRQCDRDPEYQQRVSCRNVTETLLRHDWLYRWETVLKTVGMDLLPEALERKRHLHSLAGMANNGIHSGSLQCTAVDK